MTRERIIAGLKGVKESFNLPFPELRDENIEALDAATEVIEQQRWIPVSERLPEEKINPVTQDYYEYQCTFRLGKVYDVRSYKFGRGHWWHGPGIMDEYVTAWLPLPKPWEGKK